MNPVRTARRLFALVTPVVLVGLVVLLPGCASLSGYDDDFSCSAQARGMPCSSAHEVYDATSGSLESIGQSQTHTVNHTSVVLAPVSNAARLTVPGINGPKPVRTPARVMRIYVAPWVSQSGALTMPSYLYTEIEPRRWTIGVQAQSMGRARHLYPLQIRKREPSNQDADTSGGTQAANSSLRSLTP